MLRKKGGKEKKRKILACFYCVVCTPVESFTKCQDYETMQISILVLSKAGSSRERSLCPVARSEESASLILGLKAAAAELVQTEQICFRL